MNNILSNKLVKNIIAFSKAHTFIAVVIALAALGGGWWAYGKAASASAETKYVLGTVGKGTIVASVSASGQVSASDQLDIKPKASGEVVYVGVQPGQKVAAWTLIAQLDATDAQKSARDAQANLESAQISLEKLQEPASALTLTQARNALTNAQDALTRLYNDANTHVVNAFLDLPDIVTNLEGILTNTDAGGKVQLNEDYYADAIEPYDSRAQLFKNTAHNDYVAARNAYNTAFSDYQSLGNAPDNASIEKTLSDSYAAIQLAATALKSANAFIQLYADTYKARGFAVSPAATTALANLNTYTGKANTHLSTLLSDTNSLKQDTQSITEKQQSLDETIAGADPLDIRNAKLSVTKAQNALQDAQNNLENYYIRAPFAGTIAAVNVKRYDSASSAAAAATLITSQKIAALSLNEVDAAKVKLGDKATLTFDAIDGLSLTGQVAQIDTIGAVSQGVVSYTVKIGFDTQDERIKPGMTVNAAIITDAHQDVLTVPSSAVKTQSGALFVQAFNPPLATTGGSQGVASKIAPQQISVEVGISDDTNTEIISGLSEGQQVVVRTISGTAQTTSQSSAPSLFGGTRTGTGTTRNGGGTLLIPR